MSPKITQTFDPSIGEYGQDYAVPVGTPIYSPIAGVVGTEDKGKQDWGKRVIVTATDTAAQAAGIAAFAVGHLTKFAVTAGQTVQRGQLLGYSGGAVNDPSSGNTSGPHVEPQFFGRDYKPINPVDVFKQFTSWEQAIFSGAGAAVGSAAKQFDPLAGVAGAISGATTAAQSTVSTLQTAVTRAFWFGFGFILFAIGIFLIIAGDLEKVGDRVADVAEKVAPEAAVAAA